MGSHAEYVAVTEGNVVPIPRNLGFEEATALVFGGMTSLFYLRDKGKVQPGERVVINGASGAVGSAAVQLAKHFGAIVTGICSAASASLVTSLGAVRAIDYAKEDFTRTGETYDIILDAVGNCTFARRERNSAAIARRPSGTDRRQRHARRRPEVSRIARRGRRVQTSHRSDIPLRAHRRRSCTRRYRPQERKRGHHAIVRLRR
jgi:threonine dehydrogenase-like Zn-dependent dehydrogenase